MGEEIVIPLFVAPILAFLVIVAPIWIVAHYVTRWRASKALSTEDERLLAELWRIAEQMDSRVESIERILDADTADWRKRS
ncbi:MAG: envelope stress response membrane protein PspB [Sphingomonadales bacterium]